MTKEAADREATRVCITLLIELKPRHRSAVLCPQTRDSLTRHSLSHGGQRVWVLRPLLTLLISIICLPWNFSVLLCAVEKILPRPVHETSRWLPPVSHWGQGLAQGTCSVKADRHDYWSVFSSHFVGFISKSTAHGLRLIPEALCPWIFIIWQYDCPLLLWKAGSFKKINGLYWMTSLLLVPSL